MKQQDGTGKGSTAYHHGNLREALVQAALTMIAERGVPRFAIAELARILGVSAAAPYRHFRDHDALLAEVAQRGFEGLEAELALAAKTATSNPVTALEGCAQAHLAYAGRNTAVYAAMFDQHLASSAYPELLAARDAAFMVLRRVAEAACNLSQAPRRPPPHMVALHVWSLAHGVATLFLDKDGENAGRLPMSPRELLEAGVLVYLQSLDLPTSLGGPVQAFVTRIRDATGQILTGSSGVSPPHIGRSLAMLLTKLDWLGKIAWLAFAVAWPFGFAILAYPAGSGRLHPGLVKYAGAAGTWFNFLAASQSLRRP